MKKLIIMSALVMGGLGVNSASAQLGIRIHLNLNSRPVYVPAPQPEVIDEPVYDNDYDDDYFYLPEVEAYYNVRAHMYFYNDGARWISASYLPGRYHDFDWRTARRYEIHARTPYMKHDAYRGKFGGYRDRNDYYARAYPNRGGFDQNRGREQYGNRGWDNQNRGPQYRGDDRNQNDNRGAQGRNQGGYNQPSQQQQNQGGYNQPAQNQGGQGRGQGGYTQPGQNQGGQQQQPSQGQGQQGGRGNGQQQGQGNGYSQPTNQNGGGQKGGSYTGGEHYTANKMGVVQERQDMTRPMRP